MRKLRLVRDDGSPARIEDLVEDWATIEIDGVTTSVCEVEGTGVARGVVTTGADGRMGTMHVGLVFEREFEGLAHHLWPHGGGRYEEKWLCPFARRRLERMRSTPGRRERERTINLWPDAKPS